MEALAVFSSSFCPRALTIQSRTSILFGNKCLLDLRWKLKASLWNSRSCRVYPELWRDRKGLRIQEDYSRKGRRKVVKEDTMGDDGSSGKRGAIRVFEDTDDLSTALADYVSELSESAVKKRGAFAVALAGGSLINALGKLTEAPYQKTVDWAKWYVFWVDERVVAKNHPDSNYKLIKEGFLSKVPIIPSHVYSINDALSAEKAAEDYAFSLRQLVRMRTIDVAQSTDCPKFDLILLGMGPDGHVASLFPKHPILNEKEEWVTFITDSPKPPPERVTFTLPVINSSANVAIVVTGSSKANILQKVLGEDVSQGLLPAQLVSPDDGTLVWFVDKDAASKL
eukprot:TRINITY_DN11344_c1_g2_i1.p1 TRINITY_DN11344_c1_g2~~TRINITY_DN11344_c1_g2_i1.p1  ORF type:complete len:339 (-),score=64.00 TRINITY_DN11344_c1_g2_i1:332-1348(-)